MQVPEIRSNEFGPLNLRRLTPEPIETTKKG